MFNSTRPRLSVVNDNLKTLPPSTYQRAYGHRFFIKIANQLNDEDEILKKKILQELLTLLKSPQNCLEAFNAGVVEVLLRITRDPAVHIRRAVVEALHQFLLDPAPRAIFQDPAAFLSLSATLFRLLYDAEFSIRRGVMKCLRLIAMNSKSAHRLYSSGVLLDLLIQTTWTPARFHVEERVQELCRLLLERQQTTTVKSAAALPTQGDKAAQSCCQTGHLANFGTHHMSAARQTEETGHTFSSSQAIPSAHWEQKGSVAADIIIKYALTPSTNPTPPFNYSLSSRMRHQMQPWKALRARRVRRHQWVANERSVRVRWGNRTKTCTFCHTLARQDTTADARSSTNPTITAASDFAPSATAGARFDNIDPAKDSKLADVLGCLEEDVQPHLSSTEKRAHVSEAAKSYAGHGDHLSADSYRNPPSVTSAGPSAVSWKHLRPRRLPRQRWVTIERIARVRCCGKVKHFSFSVGPYRQAEDEAATLAVGRNAPLAMVFDTPRNCELTLRYQACQRNTHENVAKSPVSQDPQELCRSEAATGVTGRRGRPGDKGNKTPQLQDDSSVTVEHLEPTDHPSANCFKESSSKLLTKTSSASWRRVRPRKLPRERWVAIERVARVRCGSMFKHFSSNFGPYRQDKNIRTVHEAAPIALSRNGPAAAVSHASVDFELTLQKQTYRTDTLEVVAKPPLSRNSQELCRNETTRKPLFSTLDVSEHHRLSDDQENEMTQLQDGGSAVVLEPLTPTLSETIKKSPVSAGGAMAQEETKAQDAVFVPLHCDVASEARNASEGSDSKEVTLCTEMCFLRGTGEHLFSVLVHLPDATQTPAFRPHIGSLALDTQNAEVDAHVLLTRAAAADLAYSILSRISSESAAALLKHVPPKVFANLFFRSFGPGLSTGHCPAITPLQQDSVENQKFTTRTALIWARQKLVVSCTRLITLVCENAFFREEMVKAKVLLYIGDLLRALLEKKFLQLVPGERLKGEDGILSVEESGRPERAKVPSLQPESCSTAKDKGEKILLQQLLVEDVASKQRKAFFYEFFFPASCPEKTTLSMDAAEACRGDVLALIAFLSLPIEGKKLCTERFLPLIAATCLLESKFNNLAYALQIVTNVCDDPHARQVLLPLLLSYLETLRKQVDPLMAAESSSSTSELLELCRLQRCCQRAINAVSKEP